MRVKTYLEKTMVELKAYKEKIDSIIPVYWAEINAHEVYLENMEGKYTPEYIAEEREKWKPKTDYYGIINAEREKRKAATDFYLELIQKSLDKYFNSPVSAEFANKVTAIKMMGLQLSDREFKLLQNSANTYMERRLLSQLAKSRTVSEARTVLDPEKAKTNYNVSEALENKQIEVSKPYWGVEVPDIEKVYSAFQNVKNNVNTVFRGYCGSNMELKEIVGCDGNNIGAIVDATHSLNCFDLEKGSYKEFLEIMEKAAEVLPSSRVKTALTESERKFIDALIPAADYEKYPTLARKRAVELARASAEVASLFMFDGRYKEDVEKALNE